MKKESLVEAGRSWRNGGVEAVVWDNTRSHTVKVVGVQEVKSIYQLSNCQSIEQNGFLKRYEIWVKTEFMGI